MKRVQSFLEKIPIFLLTIPLFIVVHIEAEFPYLIRYEFVYKEIIQLFIAPLVIVSVCFLFFRTAAKRNLFALLLCFIFFFFAEVKDYFYKISPDFFAGRYLFLIPAVLIICIGGFVIIKKSKPRFRKIFLYINLLFILFTIVDTLKILFIQGTGSQSIYLEKYALADNYKPCSSCPKPDIYYLVFDYYTSSKCLAEEFQYDNSAMDSFLLKKKFYIAKKSRSNYNFTAHSMSSALNMNYLKKTIPYTRIYLKDYLPVIGSIFDNELIQILQKEGYHINNLSIFDFKNFPPVVPLFNLWRYDLLYRRHNIFKKIDLEIGWLIKNYLSTIFTFSPPPFTYISEKDKHDKQAMDALKDTMPNDTSRHQFTYLHMETAHAPFVKDSTGKPHAIRSWPVSRQQDKDDYISQLAYTNKVLKECVTWIFENSNRPFVIILQGDHGFRFFDDKMKDKEFANLNSFYFPDQSYSTLNDSLTNVNTFRIMLNKLFGQKLELLKDSSIYIDY